MPNAPTDATTYPISNSLRRGTAPMPVDGMLSVSKHTWVKCSRNRSHRHRLQRAKTPPNQPLQIYPFRSIHSGSASRPSGDLPQCRSLHRIDCLSKGLTCERSRATHTNHPEMWRRARVRSTAISASSLPRSPQRKAFTQMWCEFFVCLVKQIQIGHTCNGV